MPSQVQKAKIVLVGDAAVGKTSLVRRFVFHQYDDRYVATLGAKVTKKEVVVRGDEGDVRVILTIWDVMGERSFQDLLREAYFHRAQGILGVADLTRPATVPALPEWIEAARSLSGEVPIVLLGNKVDLKLDHEAGAALISLGDSFRAPVRRTSAKTGENVEPAFLDLAERIFRDAAHGPRGVGGPGAPPIAEEGS